MLCLRINVKEQMGQADKEWSKTLINLECSFFSLGDSLNYRKWFRLTTYIHDIHLDSAPFLHIMFMDSGEILYTDWIPVIAEYWWTYMRSDAEGLDDKFVSHTMLNIRGYC